MANYLDKAKELANKVRVKKGLEVAKKMAKGAMVGGVVGGVAKSAGKMMIPKPIKKGTPGGTGKIGRAIEAVAMKTPPKKKITEYVSPEGKKAIIEGYKGKKPSVPPKKLTPGQKSIRDLITKSKKPKVVMY